MRMAWWLGLTLAVGCGAVGRDDAGTNTGTDAGVDAGCRPETLRVETGAASAAGVAPVSANGGSCSKTAPSARVYRFELPGTRDITVYVRPADGWTPRLALYDGDDCGSAARSCSRSSFLLATGLPAGVYSISVDGRPSTASGDFVVDVVTSVPVPSALHSGLPVTGLGAPRTGWRVFTVDPPNDAPFTVVTNGGTGHVGLYLMEGGSPSLDVWRYASTDGGTAHTLTVPDAGWITWSVGLFAEDDFADVTLTATW